LVGAKAPATVDKYSRAFIQFKTWTACYDELQALPASLCSVGLYFEHLLENNSPYSRRLESAFYGINWAHNLYGLVNPCESGLVKNILEAEKRKLAKPIKKKEPITLEMITKLCEKYAVAESSLSDIRVAAICVTAFHAFLRFSELAGLRSCDVKFICNESDSRFVELYITKSKTDVYRGGNKVLMAETNDSSCPFNILSFGQNNLRHSIKTFVCCFCLLLDRNNLFVCPPPPGSLPKTTLDILIVFFECNQHCMVGIRNVSLR
jgi:hypothetical protein